MRLMAKLFGILMVVGILIGFYSAYVEPHLLRVKQYDMKFEQVAGNPITVVQFSDTHVGDFFTTEDLKKVVDKINEQQADLVLFTGDLMDNAAEYDGSIDEIATILSKIKATNGKYAVFGNRDYGGGAERFYEDLMESAGLEVLLNSSRALEVKGTTISLFGADDALIGYYNSNKTMQGISNDHLNLLLIHEPDLISDFLSYPIDLATAGHSHGGQVYIPFYGPLLTTALAEDYVRGLYDFGNNRKTLLYVNTGIGNTKVPFRLFNVPQISVFKLEKAE